MARFADSGDELPYEALTQGVRIMVRPVYLDSQSAPEESHYVWAYQVRVRNEGAEPVQLLTRHWTITDANGRQQEVKGDGVVGEQPVIEPGETFEYTSGAPLPTPSGFMAGSYFMQLPSGDGFDAEIPAFSLDSPDDRIVVN